jgi:CHAT domain-containing protein/Tfp pilus assembly protein PilF
VRLGRPVFLLLAGWLLAASIAFGRVAENGEVLFPGESRERPIAAGEIHLYRVAAAAAPLLITVEQRGIDLVVETHGPAETTVRRTDTLSDRWAPEIVLLPPGVTGEHCIEIRSGDRFAIPGSYTLRVESLPAATDQEVRYVAALQATVLAGEFPRRTPDERSQAMAAYREALTAWRALGNHRWEAEALTLLATLELASNPKSAAEHYQEALALWRGLAEPRREAAALRLLGVAHLRSGEMAAAREAQEKSVALWQGLRERSGEAESRNELCLVEQTRGAWPMALDCYQQVLPLFRDLGDRRGEATVLNNLGGIHDSLGEPDAALARYQEALALRLDLGDRSGEAQTLNNIAVVHRGLGEWQEALRIYGQVREILRGLGDRSREAFLLNNVGYTYNSLGEPQRALSFLEDALRLRRETGDRLGEVITLNNLGNVWRSLGDWNKALAHHRQALEIAMAVDDPFGQAISRIRLGEVQLDRGDVATALQEIEPALAYLQKTGSRHAEAQALHLKARVLIMAGRPREALPVLQEALGRRRELRDGAGEADALQALAAAERTLGLAKEARAHAEAAVALVEELRGGFVSPDLRAAFLATQHRAYSLLIDLLMDRHAADPGGGHDRTALAVSEQARARSLLDVLYSGDSLQSRTVSSALTDRRRSLRYRLSAKAEQLLRKTRQEEIQSLERELDTLRAELDSVEAEIRKLDPRYAAVAAPRSLRVEDISPLLDPGTLLVEYSLGEGRSYLWAVGDGSFRSFVLPPEKEIAALARQLHEELSTVEAGAGSRRKDVAEELSRLLLGPVWPEASRYRRLIVVPDAALHLVPFAALPVPGAGGPLLDQLEIVYLPSATTLAQQRQRLQQRAPATHWAAVFADPVFERDDPRLASASAGGGQTTAQPAAEQGARQAPLADLERLPATRHEAEKIATFAPPGQVWTALDFEASREAALSGRLRDHRVLHFATHGTADTVNPELSGLVLSRVDANGRSRDGFLNLSDIYDLELDADLVVLSGCRTALGKEVRGEGVMGLTRGFFYAGVPRVVASLWRVQDRTTAELMTRFYRALWKDHRSPAAALREAQRSLRRDPRYRDSYSWAGFVLQGDWR